MKKYILTLSLAVVATTAATANEINNNVESVDTMLSVKNVNHVVITESPEGIRVGVKGLDSDDQFQNSYVIPYESNAVIKSQQKFTMPFSLLSKHFDNVVGLLGGVHFGFTGAVGAPDFMDTQMGKSFEIGLDDLIFYRYKFGVAKRNSVQVGMSVNWRNYRMTGESRFAMADDGSVIITNYPDATNGCFSRIKVFSLAFPVSYAYISPVKAIGKSNLGFKLSAIFNWNSHASMLTKYELADGTKVKENYDHIGHQKISIDMMLSVQVAPSINLYFKYTPYNLFKSGSGSPEFQTISTGIAIGGF